MKKIFLIVLSFLITSSLYSQIINFPDANFKAKLLESDSGVPIAFGIYPNGASFKIDANNNGEIEVSEVLLVRYLNVQNSNISDLTGIEYFTNLDELRCEDNFITELDVTMLPDMKTLGVNNNNITVLNIAGLSDLVNLYASDNLLSSIDFTDLSSLSVLNIENNEFSTLDFGDAINLRFIRCQNNHIENIDVSDITDLISIDCSFNTELETINIRNGYQENIDFSGIPNLQYICSDDMQLMDVKNLINVYGYTNCFANSLCSFVQGDNFYTISGNVKYDEGGNGCDLNDIDYPEVFLSFSDGTNMGNAFADTMGNYTYSVQDGNYTFTPSLENTTYFSITPDSSTLIFPEDANSNIQDFCVTANGFYPDLEITMREFDDGYDQFVTYKLTYHNNGTMTQSGSISLTYGDTMAVFNSSVPVISSQNGTELGWDFINLEPFESRDIEFVMDLSSVVEQQFGGILVNYIATIDSSLTDTTPNDNTINYGEPFFCCLLNTDEFVFSDYFSQYPNPTDEFLNIKIKKQVDVESVIIYNMLGQEVRKVSFENGQIKINVSNLESGHYFIKILTSEQEFTSRFIRK